MTSRNIKYSPDRYYDNRLVMIFICLFVFFFGLNYVVSTTFHTPLLVRWVEVGPGHWKLSSEFQGLSSLRASLFFFELFFGWIIAALFCGGDEETEGNYVFWWVLFLVGLPVLFLFVSSLWIWIAYALIMILSGWILGKKTGFMLPIGKEMLSSFKEEAHNIDVVSPRLGHLHFHGYSALYLIAAGIIIPFAFSVYFFIAAL